MKHDGKRRQSSLRPVQLRDDGELYAPSLAVLESMRASNGTTEVLEGAVSEQFEPDRVFAP